MRLWRGPQAGKVLAGLHKIRVGFEADPLLKVRVIEQANSLAELGAERLE